MRPITQDDLAMEHTARGTSHGRSSRWTTSSKPSPSLWTSWPNTAASNTTSDGHPILDPTTMAANIEVKTSNGNQVPPPAPPVLARVVVNIGSMQNIIQKLITLVVA
ncbi:hypothetical protein HAX54_046078 [Datura stramonium]|uniref:Uncharacterized protein n=1 Tax=Datura stramonium TaxID=4076 RepID=A0ABS8WII3_DATST|nr:hypothetical protein [Datura stramonium]